jgi:hypothetical protein
MNFFKNLLMLALLTASVSGQIEHAPTVQQCQADQRLWFYELENDGSNLPGIDVLRQWSKEMSVCEKVEPDHKWAYYNTSGEIDGEEITRMVNFLDRHNLWGQFIAEDAAGKR